MSNKFKEDLDFALIQLAADGPAPGDIIKYVTGIGKVVINSSTLPSGLILDPVEGLETKIRAHADEQDSPHH